MFGYSLPQKALTSVEEEAKAMWDVLNDAAHSKPSAGTNFRSERSVVQQLSTMFTSRSAEMGSASRHISRETIEKLKKYLMKWIFSRKWHHIAEERDEVTKLIRIKYINPGTRIYREVRSSGQPKTQGMRPCLSSDGWT